MESCAELNLNLAMPKEYLNPPIPDQDEDSELIAEGNYSSTNHC